MYKQFSQNSRIINKNKSLDYNNTSNNKSIINITTNKPKKISIPNKSRNKSTKPVKLNFQVNINENKPIIKLVNQNININTIINNCSTNSVTINNHQSVNSTGDRLHEEKMHRKSISLLLDNNRKKIKKTMSSSANDDKNDTNKIIDPGNVIEIKDLSNECLF